jgi:uncharacterized protein (DUF1697 family)
VTECIALIRGVNVGRAKRIAMSDLSRLVSDLGHRNVRTLLNSGNVLFECSRPDPGKLALALQNAIIEAHGFSAPVAVVTAKDLQVIVRENPLLHLATDPARHMVAFARQAGDHVTTRNWATVLKLLAASTGALRPEAQK